MGIMITWMGRYRFLGGMGGGRGAIANQMGDPCPDKEWDNPEAAFLMGDPCCDKDSDIVQVASF